MALARDSIAVLGLGLHLSTLTKSRLVFFVAGSKADSAEMQRSSDGDFPIVGPVWFLARKTFPKLETLFHLFESTTPLGLA